MDSLTYTIIDVIDKYSVLLSKLYKNYKIKGCEVSSIPLLIFFIAYNLNKEATRFSWLMFGLIIIFLRKTIVSKYKNSSPTQSIE